MSISDNFTHRLILIRHGISEGCIEGRFFGKTDTSLLADAKDQITEMSLKISPWLEEFPSLS